tara:strand:- start:647 stop:826 length:180 start_codon:yes stop_codon:yes gene_type:complete
MKFTIGVFLAIITLQFMYIKKITTDIIYLNKSLHSIKGKAISNGIKLRTNKAMYEEVCL